MRLLVIGINYAPEEGGNAPYTTGLCEHLATRGHEVHVLTGVPHYPRWRDGGLPPEAGGLRNGVYVHRRQHYVPKTQSLAHRALYEASFFGTATWSLNGLPKPDAIVAVVPILSDAVLARVGSWRFGVPYGVIAQDLVGPGVEQTGLAGNSAAAAVIGRLERWTFRDAAAVAIVSEGFRGYIESLGVRPESVVRVRNWHHLPDAVAEPAATRHRLGWPEDAFVCLHAGNMGFKQGLENVVEAALLARHQERLLFAFVGDGHRRADLQQLARGLDNVRFNGALPPEAYADALAAADLLILNQSASVTDMSFPSKLSSYTASGRPIVAAVSRESEAYRELSAAGAALLVEPGQPRVLLDAILSLESDPAMREKLGDAGRRYGQRVFSKETALAELEGFVERVGGRAALGVA